MLHHFCSWVSKRRILVQPSHTCDAREEQVWCMNFLDAEHGISDLLPAGMILQTLVFFLCLLVAVFLIIMPVLHGQNLILFQMLWSMWWASSHLLLMTRLCSQAGKSPAHFIFEGLTQTAQTRKRMLVKVETLCVCCTAMTSGCVPFCLFTSEHISLLIFVLSGPSGWWFSWLCWFNTSPAGFVSSKKQQALETSTTGDSPRLLPSIVSCVHK